MKVMPTYDAPTPAGQPEVIEVNDFPDDDEEFFEGMPSDFLSTLTAIPTVDYINQRQELIMEEQNQPQPQPQPRNLLKSLLQTSNNHQTIAQSPPIYAHYTSTTTEELSQLPSWQSMLSNVTGMRM
jgi:hypothetical protein